MQHAGRTYLLVDSAMVVRAVTGEHRRIGLSGRHSSPHSSDNDKKMELQISRGKSAAQDETASNVFHRLEKYRHLSLDLIYNTTPYRGRWLTHIQPHDAGKRRDVLLTDLCAYGKFFVEVRCSLLTRESHINHIKYTAHDVAFTHAPALCPAT